MCKCAKACPLGKLPPLCKKPVLPPLERSRWRRTNQQPRQTASGAVVCDPVETPGKCEAGEGRSRVTAMTFFLEPGSPPLDCQSQNKCVLGTGWIIKINRDVE